MEKNKRIYQIFSNDLNYVLTNLEHAIDEAKDLEEKKYFEMSKKEIIDALSYVYETIKHWQDKYEKKEYEAIIRKYNEINSIISQLELCLSDYDKKFHIQGISYSIFQIGKILSEIKKGSDKNVK